MLNCNNSSLLEFELIDRVSDFMGDFIKSPAKVEDFYTELYKEFKDVSPESYGVLSSALIGFLNADTQGNEYEKYEDKLANIPATQKLTLKFKFENIAKSVKEIEKPVNIDVSEPFVGEIPPPDGSSEIPFFEDNIDFEYDSSVIDLEPNFDNVPFDDSLIPIEEDTSQFEPPKPSIDAVERYSEFVKKTDELSDKKISSLVDLKNQNFEKLPLSFERLIKRIKAEVLDITYLNFTKKPFFIPANDVDSNIKKYLFDKTIGLANKLGIPIIKESGNPGDIDTIETLIEKISNKLPNYSTSMVLDSEIVNGNFSNVDMYIDYNIIKDFNQYLTHFDTLSHNVVFNDEGNTYHRKSTQKTQKTFNSEDKAEDALSSGSDFVKFLFTTTPKATLDGTTPIDTLDYNSTIYSLTLVTQHPSYTGRNAVNEVRLILEDLIKNSHSIKQIDKVNLTSLYNRFFANHSEANKPLDLFGKPFSSLYQMVEESVSDRDFANKVLMAVIGGVVTPTLQNYVHKESVGGSDVKPIFHINTGSATFSQLLYSIDDNEYSPTITFNNEKISVKVGKSYVVVDSKGTLISGNKEEVVVVLSKLIGTPFFSNPRNQSTIENFDKNLYKFLYLALGYKHLKTVGDPSPALVSSFKAKSNAKIIDFDFLQSLDITNFLTQLSSVIDAVMAVTPSASHKKIDGNMSAKISNVNASTSYRARINRIKEYTDNNPSAVLSNPLVKNPLIIQALVREDGIIKEDLIDGVSSVKVKSHKDLSLREGLEDLINVNYFETLSSSKGANILLMPYAYADKNTQYNLMVNLTVDSDRPKFGNSLQDTVNTYKERLKTSEKTYLTDLQNIIKDDFAGALLQSNPVISSQISNLTGYNVAEQINTILTSNGITPDFVKGEFFKNGLNFIKFYHYYPENKNKNIPSTFFSQAMYNEFKKLSDAKDENGKDYWDNHYEQLLEQEMRDLYTTGFEFSEKATMLLGNKGGTSGVYLGGDIGRNPLLDLFFFDSSYYNKAYQQISQGTILSFKNATFVELVKRNAAMTASITPYQTGGSRTLGRTSKIAIIAEPAEDVSIVTGTESQPVFDGSHFSNEFSMRKKINSLGDVFGTYPGIHHKSVAHGFDPKTGTAVFQKMADHLISSERLRNANENHKYNPVKWVKKMLSVPFKQGKITFKERDVDVSDVKTLVYDEKTNTVVEKTLNPSKEYNSMWEVYNDLGGFNTVKEVFGYDTKTAEITITKPDGSKGYYDYTDFTKDGLKHSSNIVVELEGRDWDNVLMKNKFLQNISENDTVKQKIEKENAILKATEEQSIKDSYIETLAMDSGVKTGIYNENSVDTLFDDNLLLYAEYDNSEKGIQLSAQKETEEKEATAPTQVISVTSFGGKSFKDSEDIFNALKILTQRKIEDEFAKNGIDVTVQEQVLKWLQAMSLKAIEGRTISELSKEAVLQGAFSNASVHGIISTALSSYFTKEFIRGNFQGNQLIMSPNTEQLYDIPIIKNNKVVGVKIGSGKEYRQFQREHKNFQWIVSAVDVQRGNTYKIIKDGVEEVITTNTFADIQKVKSSRYIEQLVVNRDLKTQNFFVKDISGKEIDMWDLDIVKQLQNSKNKVEIKSLTNQLQAITDNISQNKPIDVLVDGQILSFNNYTVEFQDAEIIAPPIQFSVYGFKNGAQPSDATVEHFENHIKENLWLFRKELGLGKETKESLQDLVNNPTNKLKLGQYTQKINKLAIDLQTSFRKTLDSIVARIPAQSLASSMGTKIVYFLHSEMNTVLVNPKILTLQGADMDIDKGNFLTSYTDKVGLFVKWSKKVKISDPSTYDVEPDKNASVEGITNYIYFKIKKIIDNPSNLVDRESKITTDNIKEVAKESAKGKKLYVYSPDKPSSTVFSKKANLTGKDVVGIAASAIKTLTAMYSVYHKTLVKINNATSENVKQELKSLISFNTSLFGKKYKYLSDVNLNLLDNLEDISGLLNDNSLISEVSDIKELLSKLNIQDSKLYDVLGEFLNAAVDNAKDPILGKINSGMSTAPVYMNLLTSGVELADIASLMVHPVIDYLINYTSSSLYSQGNKEQVNLEKTVEKWVKFLNMNNSDLEKVKGAYLEDYNNTMRLIKDKFNTVSIDEVKRVLYEFNRQLKGATEFTTLAQIFGINQGIASTPYDVFSKKLKFENFFKERGMEFDFEKFLHDDLYRYFKINEYDKLKIDKNILYYLAESTQFMEYLKTQSLLSKVNEQTNYKTKNTEVLFNQLIKRGYISEFESGETHYNQLSKLMDDFVLDMYLSKQTDKKLEVSVTDSFFNTNKKYLESENVKVGDIFELNLSNPEHREMFVGWCDSDFFNSLKLSTNDNIKSNYFVTNIVRDKDRKTQKPFYKVKKDLGNMKDSESVVFVESMKQALLDLDVYSTNAKSNLSYLNIVELYNLIKHSNGLSSKSFTKVLPMKKNDKMLNDIIQLQKAVVVDKWQLFDTNMLDEIGLVYGLKYNSLPKISFKKFSKSPLKYATVLVEESEEEKEQDDMLNEFSESQKTVTKEYLFSKDSKGKAKNMGEQPSHHTLINAINNSKPAINLSTYSKETEDKEIEELYNKLFTYHLIHEC